VAPFSLIGWTIAPYGDPFTLDRFIADVVEGVVERVISHNADVNGGAGGKGGTSGPFYKIDEVIEKKRLDLVFARAALFRAEFRLTTKDQAEKKQYDHEISFHEMAGSRIMV
jgi:hypothetical protein